LTTILTCSLYASDDALVRAIAEGPSESNPYVVLAAMREHGEVLPLATPRTDREATALATGLVARGARPLLGLLQVPPVWLAAFGRPLAGAFDPCTNVAIGSAMLSEFDYECAAKAAPRDERARLLERTNRRVCVLRKYEAAIGVADFADAVLLELSAQRPLSAAVAEAPIFAPAASSHWGPDQLLVPLPAVAQIATAPPTSRP
jgi:hypothetical protein